MRVEKALLALLLVSGSAAANGRLPSAGQIVLAPGDPSTLLLRTTFGVVVSSDHGESWDHVCEAAMHYGGLQDPPYALTADGSVLLVSSLGYVRGSRGAGHFDATVPLRGGRDLAVDPAGATFVLTSNFRSEDDGGAYAFASWLLRGTASGEGIRAGEGHALPGDTLFETVDAVPGDPSKLVLSGATHGSGRPDAGVLFVSEDGGAHLERLDVPLEPGETSVYIAGIEAEGARVYVRTAGGPAAPGRLLVAPFAELLARGRRHEDAGLREILRLPRALLGFALDGAGHVFAGGDDGVWMARSAELAFAQRGSTAVQCLAARPHELWACGSGAAGSLAAVSTDDGATFTTKLTLGSIRGLVATDEVRAACTQDWDKLRGEYAAAAPPEPSPWRRWVAAAIAVAVAAGWWLRRRSRRFRAAR